jgi:citrate synthase
MPGQWETTITKIQPNEIQLRGYRIDDLMGTLTFTETIALLFTGEIPDKKLGRLLDAIFISSIDHGVTPPSAQAARISVSTGASLNAAVSAGLLSINDYHGGAIFNCMTMLNHTIAGLSQNRDFETAAAVLVDTAIRERSRLPGFGHRIHRMDPRTVKLMELAEQADIKGDGIRMIKAIEKAFINANKKLPINVDGAIAAILVDIDMPHELANAFFMVARVPGLFAHAYEEKSTQKPMRHIRVAEHVYSGEENRSLQERSIK